jgi:4-amino-4-deoxy-L-arabinose transferase-like glycosyltransferase
MFLDLINNPKYSKIILICIFIICILLRFCGLDEYSFWQDELILYFHAETGMDVIWFYSLNTALHPPLFYYIYKIYTSIIPFGEFNIRVLHVLVSVFTVFLPILFRNKIDDSKAYSLSFLLACNIALIKWSQTALIYPLLLFLLVLFYCSYYHYSKSNTKKTTVLLFVISLVILYTNYFGALVILFWFLVSLVVNFKDKKKNKKTLFLMFSLFLLYLPWMLYNHLFQIVSKKGFGGINHWEDSQSSSESFLREATFIFNHDVYSFILFLSIIVLTILYCRKRLRLNNIIYSLITIIIFSIFLYRLDILVARYFVVIIPFFLIIINEFLATWNLKKRNIALIILGLYCIQRYPNANYLVGFQDIRGGIEFIRSSPEIKTIKTNVSNQKWLVPYFHKYDLYNTKTIIKVRGGCRFGDDLDKFVKSLTTGDSIITIHIQCHYRDLEKMLKINNVKFEKVHFRGVAVFIVL